MFALRLTARAIAWDRGGAAVCLLAGAGFVTVSFDPWAHHERSRMCVPTPHDEYRSHARGQDRLQQRPSALLGGRGRRRSAQGQPSGSDT